MDFHTDTQISNVESYFLKLTTAISALALSSIEKAASVLVSAYDAGRTVYLFGNGGSAALASHFACDLGKGTVCEGNGRKRFRVMALTDNIPVITAWANDAKYEDIFAEQLFNFVEPEEIAFAISGSGNSPNVLRALHVAREAGAFNIGLTGYQGGKMKDLCDLCMIVPSDNMQIIEDAHLCVAHALFTIIRTRIANSAEVVALRSGVF